MFIGIAIIFTLVCALLVFFIQVQLLFPVVSFLLLYLICISYDFYSILRFKNLTVDRPKLLTSYGNILVEQFFTWQFQTGAQISEERRKVYKSAIDHSQSLNDISLIHLIRDQDQPDDQQIYDHMLSLFSRKLNADLLCLVTSDSQGNVELFGKNIKGRKLKAKLKYLFEWYFKSGLIERDYGLVDEKYSSKEVSLLSYNYNHSIRLPLELVRKGSKTENLVFLGYRDSLEPKDQELQLAKDLVEKFKKEYEAGVAIADLERKTSSLAGSSQAKSDFITYMSHDIRSPLNNIRSILNLFKYEGNTSNNEEMLEVALTNCDSLSEIVEAILDYSKYSSGKLVANRAVFDLRALVQNILESFAVSARLKGLELRVRSNAHSYAVINADKKQVRRIVSNIVSNAIKYTENGFIEVGLLPSNSNWKLEIRDTGSGMSEDQLNVLFSPFTRFETKTADGIGLGLTLTKILVELNQGTIDVSSNLGSGSSFIVSFPRYIDEKIDQGISERFLADLVPTAADIVTEKIIDVSQVQRQSSGLRVLLVDDDSDCVDTLARGLEILGHTVFKSISVANAISIYNYELPDVVITDLYMPHGGGRRVLDYVSSLGYPVNLIILSGNANMKEKPEDYGVNVLKVYSKPVNLDDLSELLQGLEPRTLDDALFSGNLKVSVNNYTNGAPLQVIG